MRTLITFAFLIAVPAAFGQLEECIDALRKAKPPAPGTTASHDDKPIAPLSMDELLGERVPEAARAASPLPEELRAREFPPELTDRLSAYAMAYGEERTAAETVFWRSYKNEKRASPCTFDLRNGTVTIQGATYRLDVPANAKNFPSPYEMMILHAKRGDSIVFPDGHKFELGEFLGAGNATHVFSLCENGRETGNAIRIPFFSEADIGGVPPALVQRLRLSQTISYAERYSKPPEALNLVNRIPILQTGRVPVNGKNGTKLDFCTYFVVPRVRITETGEKFLEKDPATLTPGQQAMYRALKADLELLERAGHKQAPKQFGWDADHNRWVLLDWE